MSHRQSKRHPLHWVAAAVIAAAGAQAGAAEPPAPPARHAVAPAATPFAVVGDTVITHEQFDLAFAQAARGKFFHGNAPDNEVAALQREVGQSLVDDVLLAREIQRRGIRADAAAVQRTLDGYEQRYRDSQEWQRKRASVLPGLRAKLEHDDQIERLKTAVRTIAEPTEQDLQHYWQSNQDKFTTPEQLRLSVVLLKVDPSSPSSVWTAAHQEAAGIVRQLAAGGNFQEIARLRSGDPSSERGGDMGFVHRAMLPDGAQAAVDKLQAGQVSPPVQLLEGVALFRLEGRLPAKLNPLATVRARVRDLWMRDRQQQAWTTLLERLRTATPVKLDDSRFLPLATAATSIGTRPATR